MARVITLCYYYRAYYMITASFRIADSGEDYAIMFATRRR